MPHLNIWRLATLQENVRLCTGGGRAGILPNYQASENLNLEALDQGSTEIKDGHVDAMVAER